MSPEGRADSGAGISLRSVSKSYAEGRPVLRGLNLEVAPGECVALLGASGSGKSTLMRLLPGFMAADEGSGPIRIGDSLVQEDGRIAAGIRARRAEIGCVFQQFNLVGRLDVLTNVLIGLLARVPLWRSVLRRFSAEEIRAAQAALEAVGLGEMAARRASTLSGSSNASPSPAAWCSKPASSSPTNPSRRSIRRARARSWKSWPASTANKA